MLRRAISNFFTRDSRPSQHRRMEGRTLVIESPRIGFFNLLGSFAHDILQEDRAALVPMFASFEQRTDNPPECDVLMLYARLQSDGSIAGYSPGLGGIIRNSKAAIVIAASVNEIAGEVVRDKIRKLKGAIVEFTVERTGPAFTTFHKQLFEKMFAGISMPVAWNEILPQIPELAHKHPKGFGAFTHGTALVAFKRPNG